MSDPQSDTPRKLDKLIPVDREDDDDEPWIEDTRAAQRTAERAAQRLNPPIRVLDPAHPLPMVETAFLASAASLIWLVNSYFPIGPILRIFFPIPIALVYLRWGKRPAWMAALIAGLLLTVLMGPARSIQFVIPFGWLGVMLGGLWYRRAGWPVAILLGTLLTTFGAFFRFWLLSLLLGDDLWLFTTSQVTELVEWVCLKLGLLLQPSLQVIQLITIGLIVFQNLVYLFVVHIVALLMFDRLGNPIPRPPRWVEVLLEYEE
jgi:uncharacterized protein YybS (DUF2232 family)